MNALLCLTIAASISPRASAWEAVELLYKELKSPIVYEFDNAAVPSVSIVKGDSRAEKLKIFSNVLDRLISEQQGMTVLEAEWLDASLRRLDNLRMWSTGQQKDTKGLTKTGNNWRIKLNQGESLTLRDLKSKGVVSFDESVQWFLYPRFIVRAEDVNGENLLHAITVCLGGRVRRENGKVLLDIDPEKFVSRRKRFSREQMRRYPPPFDEARVTVRELDYVTAQIDLLALARLTKASVKELYRNPSHSVTIPCDENPPLWKAVFAKMNVAKRVGGGKSVVLSDRPTLFAELCGNGTVGGMTIPFNAPPWHF